MVVAAPGVIVGTGARKSAGDRILSEIGSQARRVGHAAKGVFDSTRGAFHCIGTFIKTIDLLAAHAHVIVWLQGVASQLKSYIAVSSLLRVPSTIIDVCEHSADLVDNIYRVAVKHEYSVSIFGVTQALGEEVSKVSDCASAIFYTLALFSITAVPCLNVARICGLVKDTADIGIQGIKLTKCFIEKKSTEEKLERAAVLLLKLAKAVTGVVGGIFACYLMASGVALVPLVVILIVGISGSVFALAAQFLEGYIESGKIPAKPVQMLA